jgi:hypothetical protein
MSNRSIPDEIQDYDDEFTEYMWYVNIETEQGKTSEVGKSLCVSLIKYSDGFIDEQGKCFVSVSYEKDENVHEVIYQQIDIELFQDIMGITKDEEVVYNKITDVHPAPNVTHAESRVGSKVFVNHVSTET